VDMLKIPLTDIQPNKNNPRGIDILQKDQKLESLQQSIHRFGVMVPLVVTPHNGKYTLIDGERRYHAAKMAGLSHVPAYVIESSDGDRMNDSELLYRMFQIHHLREQWGPIQQCCALEKVYLRITKRKEILDTHDIKEQLQLTVQALARDTGIDERTAADRVKFLRWPETFKKQMYLSPIESAYSYILEIEDKIVIPALANYPEYFHHVAADDVRLDLFAKLERGLARATEVRRVAPYLRDTLSKPADRKRLLNVLKELQSHPEMTYEEAQITLEREFPDLLRPQPPSPRKLLGQIETLARALEQFELKSLESARGKGRTSLIALREAVDSLADAVESFRTRAKEENLW
jgi:hypothetical protein